MQYTPGPWTHTPMQPTIWADDGQTKVATVADLPWVGNKSQWVTEEGNARLISAAPELLACCKNLLAWWEVPKGPEYGQANRNQEREVLLEAFKAAIAKAEGK